MFYNFEEEEKKVLYDYSLEDLFSLSEEELSSVGTVHIPFLLFDDAAMDKFVKKLLRLKAKTANFANITLLKS